MEGWWGWWGGGWAGDWWGGEGGGCWFWRGSCCGRLVACAGTLIHLLLLESSTTTPLSRLPPLQPLNSHPKPLLGTRRVHALDAQNPPHKPPPMHPHQPLPRRPHPLPRRPRPKRALNPPLLLSRNPLSTPRHILIRHLNPGPTILPRRTVGERDIEPEFSDLGVRT